MADVACPKCQGGTLNEFDDGVGTLLRCSQCGHTVRISESKNESVEAQVRQTRTLND